MDMLNRLNEILTSEQIFVKEPMCRHTTFRVGGPADYFVTPEDETQLRALLLLCKETDTPCCIMGNGSNMLVGDKGIRGMVIQLYNAYNAIQVQGTKIHARSGALLSAVAARALEHSLTGFEFAAGIPGTLGGACIMNAGAYGGEMKQVLEAVRVMTMDGEIKTIPADELALGYRTSILAQKHWIVLDAVLALHPGDRASIKETMDDLSYRRRSKQPLEYGSAGSTFKRPAGYFAGTLIQDAGLKGFTVGDAGVSQKHAGFVINYGNATAADVLAVIRHVQKTVKETFGVDLETEVKLVGEFA